MMESKYLILVLSAFIVIVSAYTGPDLPPGPYCVNQNGDPECCTSRQDGCSRPILDTLCYCDQFCNRTGGHDDCCPDYAPMCLGEVPPPEPLIEGPTCRHNGLTYNVQETAQIDCSKCLCVLDESTNTADWRCPDQCLISPMVLRANHYTWTPRNYSQFQGKTLTDGLMYKLGTLPLSPETQRMGPIRYDKYINYPRDFDSRTNFAGYISPVIDQGWCGSDWAVTLAAVASDRFAIQSNGAESLVLSPQTLLSCNKKKQFGCKGGNIDIAWNFAKNFGLVDEMCFPYRAELTKCPFKQHSLLREDGCRPSVKDRKTRYAMGPVGRLKAEHDIMYDIMTSGPVFAVMTVYQDFFHYGSGIYQRSQYGNTYLKGLHSVRIVGWGVENNLKYWTVANTWGENWGENGYFRIARGSNESGIESFVVSATAEVVAYQRK